MSKRNVIESISNKQLTKKDVINMINNAFPDEEVGTHGTIATVTMTELTDGTIMESVTFGKRLYCE